MSEITSQTNSQHLIDIEEEKTVFDCGHEIHTVLVNIGSTQVIFTRHLDSNGRISGTGKIGIHNLGKTQLKIFDKVKKTAKKFSTFVRTTITAVTQ